jgi:N-acetylmuramoyl-L-alanine amidase
MLIVASSSVSWANSGELDGGDFRLRLNDPVQEARTTSLNYLDLKRQPLMPRPKAEIAEMPTRPKISRFRIFLDAGHGGKDFGAQGVMGISEKDLSLKVGQLIRKRLQRESHRIHLPIEVCSVR